MSKLEAALWWQIKVALGVDGWEQEYRFHESRRWRFDFAMPALKLAVECEGHGGAKSRHTTYTGYEADAQKYNACQLDGWLLLRFTSNMIKSGEALRDIERALSVLQPAKTG